MKKISRRSFVKLVGSTAVAGAMSACSSSSSETTASGTTSTSTSSDASASTEKIELTIVGQANASGDEDKIALYAEKFAEYEALTGVKVTYEAIPDADYSTWMTTQFTAGTAPEIITMASAKLASEQEKGVIHDLTEELQTTNPYFGDEVWGDTLSAFLMEQVYNNDGRAFGIPTTFSGVRIFYNKDMFESVGITKNPETWPEFIDAMEEIQTAGYIPFAYPNASHADFVTLWFGNSFSNQLGQAEIDAMDIVGTDLLLINAEICKGYDEGYFRMQTDYMRGSLEAIKEFSAYWTSDYNGLDTNGSKDMFLRGEAAMIITGSWDLKALDEADGRSFEYGVFDIPYLTSDVYPTAIDRPVTVGGLPGDNLTINATVTGAKYDAALDFIKFFTGEEMQTASLEDLYFMPATVGLDIPDTLSGFISGDETLKLRAGYFTVLNDMWRDSFHRSVQEYLSGAKDLETTLVGLDADLASVMETIMLENDWNADNNYQLG